MSGVGETKKKKRKRVLQTEKQVKKTRTEEDSTTVANIKTMTAVNNNLDDSEKCRDVFKNQTVRVSDNPHRA